MTDETIVILSFSYFKLCFIDAEDSDDFANFFKYYPYKVAINIIKPKQFTSKT